MIPFPWIRNRQLPNPGVFPRTVLNGYFASEITPVLPTENPLPRQQCATPGYIFLIRVFQRHTPPCSTASAELLHTVPERYRTLRQYSSPPMIPIPCG